MDTRLLKEYAKLDQDRKELKEQDEHMKRRQQELESEILEGFLEEGIQKFTVAVQTSSGEWVDRTLYFQRRLWASYNQNEIGDGKFQLVQSLERSGFGDLVEKSFNHNKLSAWVREYDETGGDEAEVVKERLPDEIKDHIKISETQNIRTKKS